MFNARWSARWEFNIIDTFQQSNPTNIERVESCSTKADQAKLVERPNWKHCKWRGWKTSAKVATTTSLTAKQMRSNAMRRLLMSGDIIELPDSSQVCEKWEFHLRELISALSAHLPTAQVDTWTTANNSQFKLVHNLNSLPLSLQLLHYGLNN